MAIQALLDEIKAVGKPAPVSAAALAADRTAVQKKGGIAAKTAAKVATDEHTLDQFLEEQEVRLDTYNKRPPGVCVICRLYENLR